VVSRCSAAGAATAFSVLTGLSVGVFVLDPLPWLVAGVCLDGSALLAYGLLRRLRPI